MLGKRQARCLLVVFAERPALYLADAYPLEGFLLGARQFQERVKSVGGLSGFYDWLRDGSSRIIGVRQMLFDEIDHVRGDLDFEYVASRPGFFESSLLTAGAMCLNALPIRISVTMASSIQPMAVARSPSRWTR